MPGVQTDWAPALQLLKGIPFGLWDPLTGASRGTLKGHSCGVTAVTFSPDGQLLASASDDMTVRLWDPSTGTARGTLKCHNSSNAAVFSPDSQLLVTAEGALRSTLDSHCDHVEAVAFSPNGQLLASASSDSTIRLWDLATGASCGILEGHGGSHAVAFSSDGQLLAPASYRTIRLWDIQTKEAIQVLSTKNTLVNCLSPVTDRISRQIKGY
ncbi:WD40-repeat-containing domain protein [Trichophaea hybrida]|nr:WD40-repeat-containing domain protein [Trichophaea hybrida]